MRIPVCAAAALWLASAAARAGNSVADAGAPWPTFIDMPRATAMGGAHAAIVTGNDAIVVNPAGLAQLRRYHFEADGVLDSSFPAQGLILSIGDSLSGPAATGFLFSRWGSGQPGGRGEGWLGGLSYAYGSGGLYFGGHTKYLRFAGPDGPIHRFAQDVGVLSRRGRFGYAVVVQNLAPRNIPLFPLTSTVGVAWGDDHEWHIAFDYKADLSELQNVKHRLAGGLEILFEPFVLRGGGTWDASNRLGWASFGIGLLTEKGGGQFVWRRRVSGQGDDQFFEAGITLYLE